MSEDSSGFSVSTYPPSARASVLLAEQFVVFEQAAGMLLVTGKPQGQWAIRPRLPRWGLVQVVDVRAGTDVTVPANLVHDGGGECRDDCFVLCHQNRGPDNDRWWRLLTMKSVADTFRRMDDGSYTADGMALFAERHEVSGAELEAMQDQLAGADFPENRRLLGRTSFLTEARTELDEDYWSLPLLANGDIPRLMRDAWRAAQDLLGDVGDLYQDLAALTGTTTLAEMIDVHRRLGALLARLATEQDALMGRALDDAVTTYARRRSMLAAAGLLPLFEQLWDGVDAKLLSDFRSFVSLFTFRHYVLDVFFDPQTLERNRMVHRLGARRGVEEPSIKSPRRGQVRAVIPLRAVEEQLRCAGTDFDTCSDDTLRTVLRSLAGGAIMGEIVRQRFGTEAG